MAAQEERKLKMVLRGKRPETADKRLKMLVYGPAGSGKTWAAISMPRVYLIDCEGGADHYADKIDAGGGVVFRSNNFEDVAQEIRSLTNDRHDYLTVAIDPITTAYDNLLDECEGVVGSEYGRHYAAANKKMKQLYGLISVMDMNVIMIAHSKPIYDNKLTTVGTTFDAWKKLDYLFDLAIELESAQGRTFAKVVKTRIDGFPRDDRFEWSYDAVAERYGRDILERGVTPITLSTPGHVDEFEGLVRQLSQDEVKKLKIDKVLSQYPDLSDMPDERIVKGIALVRDHIEKRNARDGEFLNAFQGDDPPPPAKKSTKNKKSRSEKIEPVPDAYEKAAIVVSERSNISIIAAENRICAWFKSEFPDQPSPKQELQEDHAAALTAAVAAGKMDSPK